MFAREFLLFLSRAQMRHFITREDKDHGDIILTGGIEMLRYCVCCVVGDSSGGAQPHYQVFLELRGVRNLTEEQRYKV